MPGLPNSTKPKRACFDTFDAVQARMAFAARFVVLTENADATWTQREADDVYHAKLIARNAVTNLKARGASCWKVVPSGKLGRTAFFMEFDNGVTYKDDYELELEQEAAWWDRDIEARNQFDA